MANPPTPLPRTPPPARRVVAPPAPVVVSRGAQPASSAPSNRTASVGESFSPDTAVEVRPLLRPAKERIQIVGDSNAGKTFAYLQLAESLLKRHGANAPKFYVIDTDDTMPDMLNEGFEFEHLYDQNGGNVVPIPAFSWKEFSGAERYALSKVKPGDWIVVDIGSRAYEYAQQVVAAARGFNLDDTWITRGLNKQGFGAFDGNDWNLVNRMFDAAFDRLVKHPTLNVITTSHITDLQADTPGREKRQVMAMFDQVGMKPRSAPKIPGFMRTVLFLWNVRRVTRDERKQRIGAETVRWLTLVKDRGSVTYANVILDRPFYEKLLQIREEARTRQLNINITDEQEAHRATEEALAAVEAMENAGDTTTLPVQDEPESEEDA